MSDLRTRLIRLASENKALRPHILPLLAKSATEFGSKEEMEKYLKDHPGADKSKHTFKKPSGGKKDEPSEEKIKVTDGKAIGEILSPWSSGGDILQQVGSHLSGGHPLPRAKLQEAHDHIETMLKTPDRYHMEKSDIRDLSKVQRSLAKHLK